jgi:hypothetical protein
MRLVVFLFFSSVAFAQQSVSTSSPCSPIAPKNTGSITINCPGISKEQGQKILTVVNKILADHLDADAVMKALNSIAKSVEEVRKQDEFSGLLTPGNEPTPPNACDRFSPTDNLVILGTNAAIITKPITTVIAINQEPILVMEKTDGHLYINVKFFSRDGRIVAELSRNQFFINPNNYFRKQFSQDGHSLVIYDQNDLKVLDVRFLNPATVKFLGIIRNPSFDVVISDVDGISLPGIGAHSSGECFYHPLGGIYSFGLPVP